MCWFGHCAGSWPSSRKLQLFPRALNFSLPALNLQGREAGGGSAVKPLEAMAAAHRSTASVGSRGRPEILSEEEFSERCGAESCLEQEHRHSGYTESHDDAKQAAVDVVDECVKGGGRGGGGERHCYETTVPVQ